jgi:argininosuccinate lyase
MAEPKAMWGGRFATGPDALFRAFNDSLPIDWRLVRQDIAGSIAWTKALGGAGVLSDDEVARLVSALHDLDVEVQGTPSFPEDSGAEDVHSWVEARLIAMLGDLGKKLHTGRSRNDQVATDLRLWTRDAIDNRLGEIRAVQMQLVAMGEREIKTPMPGYTHLQRAQPILLAHWCLAYVEMLERDADRLTDARRRVNVCPLGSAALAGTTYAINREAIANDLGFDSITANSLDAVSDRDYVVETINASALTAVHLSRIAEEMILFATAEFGFFAYDDGVTSGSSIMPQKKNPDALELVRGKCGRIAGHQTSMMVMLKGLPLAYNKDTQEDKEPLFDAMDQLSLCLRMLARVLSGTMVDREACEMAAKGGYSNATELADYLVGKGVAFRDAHGQVGRLVREAITQGAALEDLPIDVIRAHAPAAGEDVYGCLSLTATLARRDVPGGTAPGRVAAALREAAERIARSSPIPHSTETPGGVSA